jgi:hypothetical protein
LLWRLKPSAERPGRFLLFAFTVPVVFCALYFLALQMTLGIEWTVHLWLGAIFMAGIVGLFVGFLTVTPLMPGVKATGPDSLWWHTDTLPEPTQR